MAIFKCKMCGGTLEITENQTVCECEYCGTQQTLPKLSDDKKANMYDRANHFRRNNEFDKAMGIYEQILNEDSADSEAYWSLVLCRYGIEYVDDSTTHKKVPTVNRAQYTSIFDDDNYKSAIANADALQKTVYEEEAKAINEIQKGILEISQKEEPFDIFICYKETDNNGRRTQDSVIANDLYHQLTQEGFKVFFARITLEDKLGTAYEPYIFAALNSAKVMVVLGTKPEYFNAVWVKNEWSRYLAIVKQSNGKKMLIPAYRDMDPYDLPDEFSHLQAQDMSKLGFMQDLIRGIKKILGTDQSKVQETVVVQQTGANSNITALLKRGMMALEDKEWNKADEFFEEVLNQDAENGEAFFGKFLAQNQVDSIEKQTSKTIANIENEKVKNDTKVVEELKAESEQHSVEQSQKYTIPDYLNNSEVNDLYKFSFEYKSKSNSYIKQKENYMSNLENDKILNRCKRYCTGETKEKVQKYIDDIEKLLNQHIYEAEKIDENSAQDITERYREFVRIKDEEIIQLHNDALNKREERYQSIIKKYNEANELETFHSVKEEFFSMRGYKDSDDFIKKCDEGILEWKYNDAVTFYKSANKEIQFKEAKTKFTEIYDYKDAANYVRKCFDDIKRLKKEQEERDERARQEARQEQRKAEKKKMLSSIIGAVIIVVLFVTIIVISSVYKFNKYNHAVRLKEEGKYQEAYDEFDQLGNYKDSSAQMQDEEMNNGLLKAGAVGFTVSFGSYNSSNTWIILEKEGDKVLLISEDCIADRKYNIDSPVTWETCALRHWLNDIYYNSAFNENEKSMIVKTKVVNKDNADGGNDTDDYIFLLSIDEVNKYLDIRQASLGRSWWLRSMGYGGDNAAYVESTGIVSKYGKDVDIDSGVRPALWIKVE